MPALRLVCLLAVLFALSLPARSAGRDRWKAIDRALAAGRLKAALPLVLQAERKAAAERQPLQRLKALVCEGRIRIVIEDYDADAGRHPAADFLARFDRTRREQPAGTAGRVLFDLYMAEFLRQMAERPGFGTRTRLAGTAGQGFDTWSRDDLLALADTLYDEAASADSALLHTPRAAFELLCNGPDTDRTAPLLVDFAAPRAAAWFNDEAGQPLRAEALLRLRAGAHAADADKTAWLDAQLQLERHRVATGASAPAGSIARLCGLASAHRDTPYAAVLWRQAASWAGSLTEHSDSARNVRRHALLTAGMTLFPESKWAAGLSNDLAETESTDIALSVFSVNSPEHHVPLHVVHRNAHQLALTLERLDAATAADALAAPFKAGARRTLRQSLKCTLLREETLTLRRFDDFLPHATVCDLGRLPRGVYRVTLSSGDKSDDALFAVSGVAATLLPGAAEDTVRVRFSDTIDGRPLAGEDILLRPAGKPGQPPAQGRTDADGCLALPAGKDEKKFVVLFPRLDDAATAAVVCIPTAEPAAGTDRTQVTFLTDRAVYRPGQKISFKLIAARDSASIPRPATGEEVCVVLRGASSEALDSMRLTANAFGSAAGSFVLPASALPGRFALEAGAHNWQIFEVEAYKRPKFEVTVAPVEGAYAAGDSITLTGRAEALAGPALTGVPVTWKLERQQLAPYGRPGRGRQRDVRTVLAEGTAVTDADGAFSVRICLDKDSLTADGTFFMSAYFFTAAVTDFGGETQTAVHAFHAGRNRLTLALDAPSGIRAADLRSIGLRAVNADGRPVAVKGRITLTRMGTKRPPRTLWPHRQFDTDYARCDYDDFVSAFPYLRYENGENSFDTENETVLALDFDTATGDSTSLGQPLAPGVYLCRAETVVEGDTLCARQRLTLLTDSLTLPGSKTFFTQHAPKGELTPGETTEIVWHSDLPDAELLVCVERYGKMQPLLRKSFCNGRATLTLSADAADIGRGICWQAILTAAGERATASGRIEVAGRRHATLDVKVNTFRSYLEPGADECWTLTVTHKGRPVRAEVAATLYDAALDGFARHSFRFVPPRRAGKSLVLEPTSWIRRQLSTPLSAEDGGNFSFASRKWREESQLERPTLDFFGLDLLYPYLYKTKNPRFLSGSSTTTAENSFEAGMESAAQRYKAAALTMTGATADKDAAEAGRAGLTPGGGTPSAPRRALQETAFFFPGLPVEAGQGTLRFTAPEALTRWHLLLLAHTDSLDCGTAELEIETRKPLMLAPALPRFVRQGDTLCIAAKITSTLDTMLTGTSRLQLFDMETGQDLGRNFGLEQAEQPFRLAAAGSGEVTWIIAVPDGDTEGVGLRLTAECAAGADGEEHFLPILPRRAVLLRTEALSLRPGEKKVLDLPLTTADTRLTLELCTDLTVPALLALPSLVRPEHESCDQTLTRIFAAHAAEALLARRPELREAVGAWNRHALASALSRNAGLQRIAPEATPWVGAAGDEAARAEAMAELLDDSLRAAASREAWTRLRAAQNADGGFPWFAGGASSAATTQRIVETAGRTRALCPKAGGATADTLLRRAAAFLDSLMLARVDRCAGSGTKLPAGVLLPYLYARAASRSELALPARLDRLAGAAVDEALRPATLTGMSAEEKARAALTAWRYGQKRKARRLLAHLRETAVADESRGMYWREAVHRAPASGNAVSAHALALTAFAEIAPADSAAREGIATWIAGSRRRTDWGAPQATADAVAAIAGAEMALGRAETGGSVRLTAAGNELPTNRALITQGYFKLTLDKFELTQTKFPLTLNNETGRPLRGALTAERKADTSSFGSGGAGMRVTRGYYAPQTADGRTLLERRHSATRGERLVERVTVQTSEPLAFVHLRLDRPAGLEPADSRSGHVPAGGTAAWRSVCDDATHLFFDLLPAGTHVFEHELRAAAAGVFGSGRAEIECLYAPEYRAREAGETLHIGR